MRLLHNTVLILVVTLYGFDGKPNSDIAIISVWSMLILSFPSSLLYCALVVLVATVKEKYFGSVISESYFTLILDWTGFFTLGYLQWFKLFPWLWRQWKISAKP